MKLFLAGFLLILLTASGFARTVTFANDNFTVDLPDDFTERSSDVEDVVLAADNPDHSKSIYVHIVENEYRQVDEPTFKPFISNVLAKMGSTMLDSSVREINGYKFLVCTSLRKDGNKEIYAVIGADKRMFLLTYLSGAPGGPDINDPEFQAFVNSFHFINPPQFYHYYEDDPRNQPAQFIGKLLVFLALLVILIAIRWFSTSGSSGYSDPQPVFGCVGLFGATVMIAIMSCLILYFAEHESDRPESVPVSSQTPTEAPAAAPVVMAATSLSLTPVPTLVPVPTQSQGWVAPPVNTTYPNDWRTTDGKSYKNVQVVKVEADRVTITSDDGICMVPIDTLPLDIKKQLNYDPVEAGKAAAQHFLDQVNDRVSKIR